MSPYLDMRPRTLEEMVALHSIQAMRIREQTKSAVRQLREAYMPAWTYRQIVAELKWARQMHTKHILDREEYRAAIRERDIQRSLGLMVGVEP